MFSLATLLTLALPGLALAQKKVAEGEYAMRSTSSTGTSPGKTTTRWVLYSKRQAGYRLESEILNLPAGLRVVQTEELDEKLVPTAVGFEGYSKDQKQPSVVFNCKVAGDSISCSGQVAGKRAVVSRPYEHKGPFWLWPDGLFAIDMPWLMGGAANMARHENQKLPINTLTAYGGPAWVLGDAVNVAKLEAVRAPGQKLEVHGADPEAAWDFDSEEEGPLQFVGNEDLEVSGAKIATGHYSIKSPKSGGTDLWISESGLVIKMSGGEESEFVLNSYRQYRKMIPELKVEDSR